MALHVGGGGGGHTVMRADDIVESVCDNPSRVFLQEVRISTAGLKITNLFTQPVVCILVVRWSLAGWSSAGFHQCV